MASITCPSSTTSARRGCLAFARRHVRRAGGQGSGSGSEVGRGGGATRLDQRARAGALSTAARDRRLRDVPDQLGREDAQAHDPRRVPRPRVSRDRFLEANGIRLHYLDSGGDGPPLVLVPASLRTRTRSAGCWRPVSGSGSVCWSSTRVAAARATGTASSGTTRFRPTIATTPWSFRTARSGRAAARSTFAR